MSLYNDYCMFYKIAGWAIKTGYLTPAEVRLISRVGTRKTGIWSRALRDLKDTIRERQAMRVDK